MSRESNKIRVLIVDDEQPGREGNYLLSQQVEGVEVVGMAENGISAIQMMDELQPDVVLLDIDMPDMTGFDVLRSVQRIPTAVIFVTAYDEFALKAFEFHAVDYLLKPVRESRFQEAMMKASRMIISAEKPQNLESLLEEELNRKGQKDTNDVLADASRLCLKNNGKWEFHAFEDVFSIEAFDYYVKVITGEKTILQRIPLKSVQNVLPKQFFRIHRSAIVNLDQMQRVIPLKNKEFEIVLKNGKRMKVSRGYGKDFEKEIDNFPHLLQ